MKKLAFLLLFISCSATLIAQGGLPEVKVIHQGTKTSIRGLSVVNDVVVWACGSNGTIGKTTDGGKTWKWTLVKGFEKRDFRDIEAWDGATAIVMAVDTPAYILKTTNGGDSWKVVYENNKTGMFLDALEFWNDQSGIVVGDPIDGKIFIARTFDGGNSWQEIPEKVKPAAQAGEALFAASGTNIRALDKDEAVFVTGGLQTNLFIRDAITPLPIIHGKETSGANSIAVMDANSRNGGRTMIVVGGDFNAPAADSLNCFYSTDRGKTWIAPKVPPHGYRSCVEYLSKTNVVTCGINGVDYSTDGGKRWRLISTEGFNVCRIAKKGSVTYLAGNNGKIAKLIFDKQQRR
ncbi:MAG: oxidoreductase [Chitinophagaceae bacterium]